MYCSSCGKYIGEGRLFCPECGTKQDVAYQQQEVFRPNERQKPDRLGTLTLWCVIAIFFCWPIAIYGFIKRSKALKATSIQEANAIVAQAIKNIWIWCGIVFAIGFIYGFIGTL